MAQGLQLSKVALLHPLSQRIDRLASVRALRIELSHHLMLRARTATLQVLLHARTCGTAAAAAAANAASRTAAGLGESLKSFRRKAL